MNVLLECTRKQIPVKEVGIRTIYLDKNSRSHFRAFADSLRICKDIIRFAASSLIGFVIDYSIYSLLLLCIVKMNLVNGLIISNICARIVSSMVNYTINRNVVFQSKERVSKTATAYFILALCILVLNTIILSLLVNVCGVNQWLAKLFTEILMFLISWLMQKFFVFKR